MTTTSAAPLTRDRMAGRYFGQCPTCRNHRHLGPDCPGNGPVPARQRRKRERRDLERCLRDQLGTAPNDPLVDESDCRHGCNGLCLRSGSDRCNFTCHRDWNTVFPGQLIIAAGARMPDESAGSESPDASGLEDYCRHYQEALRRSGFAHFQRRPAVLMLPWPPCGECAAEARTAWVAEVEAKLRAALAAAAERRAFKWDEDPYFVASREVGLWYYDRLPGDEP